MIKTDLRQGFPVYYRGRTDNNSRHAFLIDGFDVDGNQFQINFGWNGIANGMYVLYDLNGFNND